MMTCKDFAERLDLYLDHRLARDEQLAVDRHLSGCKSCRAFAGAHQEREVVLRTAVTDVVAAVDLSGLWKAVHRAVEREPQPQAEPAWTRAWARLRRRWIGWGTASPFALTPLRMTAAAGVAVVVGMVAFQLGGPNATESTRVATRVAPAPIASSSSHSPIRNVRIDSLEAAEGHTVATWRQPRTGAQVIWVADAGAPISAIDTDLRH